MGTAAALGEYVVENAVGAAAALGAYIVDNAAVSVRDCNLHYLLSKAFAVAPQADGSASSFAPAATRIGNVKRVD